MPFRALQDKDFTGRREELAFLIRRALQADAAAAESIVIEGCRGMGKTELLKQLFGHLFWDQDRVVPVYHAINPAGLSASRFARAFLIRFLCQRIAFEKKEQALFAGEGAGLDDLYGIAEERNLGWVRELLDDYRKTAGDPLSELRFAFATPHRSALMSGVPVVVLIDSFHRLRQLALDGSPDPSLISLMEEPLSSPRAPFIIAGNASELNDIPLMAGLERLVLAPLESPDAAAIFQSVLAAHGVETPVPPLLLRRLGGNPWYLNRAAKAACSSKTVDERSLWGAYVKEISEGVLFHSWCAAIKNLFPFSGRKSALVMSHKIFHAPLPVPVKQLAASLMLPEDAAEQIAQGLSLAGVAKGEFGVLRPADDQVLRDVIDCLYGKEALAKSQYQLASDCLEKLLSEPPGVERFDLVLPMTKESELVAAQCVEQVGKNLNLHQELIGQIQIAVIEACINAQEHSRGIDKKIYVSVIADGSKLEVSVESEGQEFIVLETGEPFGSRGPEKAGGRGWGIKLMKRFVDDVRFEKTPRGTKTVLVKHLGNPAGPAEKEEEASHE